MSLTESSVLTTNLTVIASNSPARLQIPTSGRRWLDWTAINYDDSSWVSRTNGVGFGSTNVAQAITEAAVAPIAPLAIGGSTKARHGRSDAVARQPDAL